MNKQLFDQISDTLRRAELANQHYCTDSLKWNLDTHKAQHQHLRSLLREIYEVLLPITIVSMMKAISLPGISELELHEVLHPQLKTPHKAYGVTATLYHLQAHKQVWLQQLGKEERPELVHYINEARRYVLQFENLLGDLEEAVVV